MVSTSGSSSYTANCCARLHRNCSGRIRAEPTRPRKAVLAGRVHPQVILPAAAPSQLSALEPIKERRRRLICLRRPVIYVVRVYRRRQRRRPTEKTQALEVRNSWMEGRPTTADRLTDVHTAEIALGVAPSPIVRRNSGMSKVERITGTALSISLYNEPMDTSRRSSMESVTRESYQPSTPLSIRPSAEGLCKAAATVSISDIPLSPTSSDLSDLSDVNSRITHQLAAPPPPPPPSLLRYYPALAALSRINSEDGAAEKPKHIATQYTPPRFQRRRSSAVRFPTWRESSSLASDFTTTTFGSSNDSVSTLSRRTSSILPLPPPAAKRHRRSWSGRSILHLDIPPTLPPVPPPALPQTTPRTRTYSTTTSISTISSLSLGAGGASFRGLSPRPPTMDTETELREEMARIREHARRHSNERRRRRREAEEEEEDDGDEEQMGRWKGAEDMADALGPAREGFRFL